MDAVTKAVNFNHWNWHMVKFDKVSGHLRRLLIKYGLPAQFPILKGGNPRTDGKHIWQTTEKHDFKDNTKKVPSHENKNITLYHSDMLHEMLHILERSFAVDAREYLKQYDNPDLAFRINNIIDDARIEHNGNLNRLEANDSLILANTNIYYASRHSSRERPFDEDEGARLLEMWGSLLISKVTPAQAIKQLYLDVAPTSRPHELLQKEKQTIYDKVMPKEQETMDAPASEKLQAQGLMTQRDVLDKLLELSSEVYYPGGDAPITKVWETLPKVYELLMEAAPSLQKYNACNSPFQAVMSMPMQDGDQGQPGQGQPGQGQPGQGQPGQGQPGQGQPGQGGQGDEDGNEQAMHVGFRGDIHDFSQGEQKDIEDMIGEHQKEKEKEEKEGKSGSKGSGGIPVSPGHSSTGQGEGKPPNTINIITYDHNKKKYLHVSQLEFAKYPRTDPNFEAKLDRYSNIKEQIIGHFLELQPNELQRRQYSEDPHELNMEAVIEVLSDPNLRGDAKVFDSYFVNKRNTIWYILCDISGSTSAGAGDGRRVIDVEKDAMGLLKQSLESIGDTVHTYAFSSGRTKTILYRLESLAEIGGLQPEDANADGVAVRGVIVDSKRHDAQEKHLIVISDGWPVACGYSGGDPVIDTSLSFQEAHAEGLSPIYINVCRDRTNFEVISRHCIYARNIVRVPALVPVVSDLVMEVG